MRDFKTLRVWQQSHALTLQVYRMTNAFPKHEQYGLVSQIQRACVSIPANIAEGCGRDSDNELRRFCQIAMGSASEVEYYLLLTHDLKLITDETYNTLNKELITIKKMLNTFIQRLKVKVR